jgi:hypothetical protein
MARINKPAMLRAQEEDIARLLIVLNARLRNRKHSLRSITVTKAIDKGLCHLPCSNRNLAVH